MGQLAGWRTVKTAAQVCDQYTHQQVTQTGFCVCVAQLRAHQCPERWRQVIGRNLLPGLGLRSQVGFAIHHQRGEQSLQHGKQFGLVSTSQHRQHLAIQVGRAVARQHQAFEALHPILGAQELGPLFQMVAQCLRGQAQVFQQDGRGVGPKRLAAQAHVQQPVLRGLGLGLGAVDQPALAWRALNVNFHLQRGRFVQAHQLYAVKLQAIHDRCELRLHVVPEHHRTSAEQAG